METDHFEHLLEPQVHDNAHRLAIVVDRSNVRVVVLEEVAHEAIGVRL